MAVNDLIKVYSERKTTYQEQAKKVQSDAISISWVRVAVVLLAILFFYFGLEHTLLLWVSAILIVLYMYLVSVHEKLNDQKSLFENLSSINDSEARALKGDHTSFHDGSEFIDAQHPYIVDLDIFGKGSVFQRINRTCTEPGKERLAGMLSSPLVSAETIHERQESIRELQSKIDFRQTFQAIGLRSTEKKEDQQQLLRWLKRENIVLGKSSYRLMLTGLPVLSAITLLFWIIQGVYAPFVGIALIQWAIIGVHAKKVTLFQDFIGNKRYLLQKYATHIELLNKETFAANSLKSLTAQSHEAHKEISSLASRSRALDLRLNLFANILFNSTILYDLQCVYRLEQWRDKNKDHLKQWLDAVHEADALNSLATFAFNHPDFIFPEVTNEPVVTGEELGHPLIPSSACVVNSISLGKPAPLWIVTGANMAGKSTFLRTVGVNVVLAMTGSVVYAKSLKCPIIDVYSGMRNTDSINENQSYFFAELLRLHNIVEQLKSGKPLLILLDEILKGTNSGDKLTGSRELVGQLVDLPCIGLIATHDLALGEMEKEFPEKVSNWHFETYILNDELSFDYKLKPGVSHSKNATFLMKKMGIIPH